MLIKILCVFVGQGQVWCQRRFQSGHEWEPTTSQRLDFGMGRTAAMPHGALREKRWDERDTHYQGKWLGGGCGDQFPVGGISESSEKSQGINFMTGYRNKNEKNWSSSPRQKYQFGLGQSIYWLIDWLIKWLVVRLLVRLINCLSIDWSICWAYEILMIFFLSFSSTFFNAS